MRYLVERELIRSGPFDAAPCPGAAVTDLDPERMARFIRDARRERAFPLPEKASPAELLSHLNLLAAGKPTTTSVCGTCHAKDAIVASTAPRISMASHGNGLVCWQCHYPHRPEVE